MIDLTVRMIITVPQEWGADEIDFYLNESSHCLGNEILQLAEEEQSKPGTCFTCFRAEARYVRDATAGDLEALRPESEGN